MRIGFVILLIGFFQFWSCIGGNNSKPVRYSISSDSPKTKIISLVETKYRKGGDLYLNLIDSFLGIRISQKFKYLDSNYYQSKLNIEGLLFNNLLTIDTSWLSLKNNSIPFAINSLGILNKRSEEDTNCIFISNKNHRFTIFIFHNPYLNGMNNYVYNIIVVNYKEQINDRLKIYRNVNRENLYWSELIKDCRDTFYLKSDKS